MFRICDLISRLPIYCILVVVTIWRGEVFAFSPEIYADRSVLAEGKWVKISVENTGIHFISLSELKTMGFSNIEDVGIYGYGGGRLPEVLDSRTYTDDLPRIQTYVTHEGIYFYGVGPLERKNDINGLAVMTQNPFTSAGYYFISDRGGTPAREITEIGEAGSVKPVNHFIECIHHELDIVSPGQTGHYMVGEDLRYTPTRRFVFTLTGAVSGGMVRAGASVCANLTSASSWNLSVADQTIAVAVATTPSGDEYHGVVTEGWTRDFAFERGENIEVSVTMSGNPGNARGAWLDWITVNYEREISLKHVSSIVFQTDEAEISLSGASPQTQIWDVTNPLEINRIRNDLSDDGIATFTTLQKGQRTYAAFTPGNNYNIMTPKYVGSISNQNLHGFSADIDMVIFTSQKFLSAANMLAQHRRDFSGLNVAVVVQDDVFNEFSSGSRDVGAFRKFLKMIYDRGNNGSSALKYVLMLGRGSYDNRGVTKATAALDYELMPLWQTDYGLNDNNSFTTDDMTAMLSDGSGADPGSDTLSVAIGRIPVTSTTEAHIVVSKIIDYETTPPDGQWRQHAVVIADDDDDCVHMRQAEMHCENIASGNIGKRMLVDKIYLDAYPLTNGEAVGAREAFYRSLDEGTVWVSYIGHASTTALSGEGIMKYSDIGSLYLRRLPFIYAATCNFMRWDADAISGAEMLAATKGGGVIGAISATRPVYITQNGTFSSILGEEFSKQNEVGNIWTIGDILRRTKNRLSGDNNKLRFALLGDPAMRLAIPCNDIVVDTIDGVATDSDEVPILSARQDVTVSGHVEGADGTLLSSFDGQLVSTLYDADESVVTEGRGGSPFTFDRHGLRLFVGNDSVIAGRFNMKITMPASVADNFREASLTLFAKSIDGATAADNFRDLYVYGSDESSVPDTVAPQIESIYLNHPSFTNGSTVNATPMLIANISDNHAINLSLAGVGQSMSVSIDGGTVVCNDVSSYYHPSTVASGILQYPLPQLDDGYHMLTLRVWDTDGNSVSESIEFFVDSSSQPTVYDIYTSATPASSTVSFYLIHDRPHATLRVTIAVYDLWGRPVWINTTTGRSDLFTSYPVEWNLTDMGGGRVQRGIYLYRAWVSEYNGTNGSGAETVTPTRKMAISGN